MVMLNVTVYWAEVLSFYGNGKAFMLNTSGTTLVGMCNFPTHSVFTLPEEHLVNFSLVNVEACVSELKTLTNPTVQHGR